MTKQLTPDNHQWDTFVRSHPRGHVLQLSAWGQLKSAYGWDARRVTLARANGGIRAGAQLLFRRLPLGLGTMAYLPMGPLLSDEVDSQALWQAVDASARSSSARLIKWEPGIYLEGETQPDFAALCFHESAQNIQPPRTILIDVSSDDDTIMGRMNQGTRRKIRQSYKKGVRFYHGVREDIDTFNTLMQTTGERNEFGVHEPGYYELAYDLFVPAGDATVILAEHESDPLAAIMVFALGDFAWYISGASSSHKRNLMASYGIQWEAIQWARARGCRYYDMWGIPDEDEGTLEAQFQDRSDGLWGVYGFKRGWGGEVIRATGTWDKPYNRLVYAAYAAALCLRGS